MDLDFSSECGYNADYTCFAIKMISNAITSDLSFSAVYFELTESIATRRRDALMPLLYRPVHANVFVQYRAMDVSPPSTILHSDPGT